MLIEIRNTNFLNKGAELMLHAILQKVREALPESDFAVAPSGSDEFLKRSRLELYQKIWLERYGIQWGWLGKMVPKKLRLYYGLILDNEIDVVLDASGFAYGDQCGERYALAMASYVKKWKRRGTKIILLPQAMGPFSSHKLRKAFSTIISNADLVFPRDEVSYRHVIELVGKQDKIYKSPDFTNLVPGEIPRDPEQFRERYCLVPNYRMIDRTSQEDRKRYTIFCAMCIKLLIQLGHKPFILIHEGKQDILLARQIVEKVGTDIDIVIEKDALRVKGILGLCSGVISSRFHGLVSALSQGIPALATGWSHKYEMLFKEYGIPDGCICVSINPETLNKQVQRIVDCASRKEIIDTISKASALHKEQTEMMWQKVFSIF